MNLTRDAFLGGRVQALQPEKGFRSGMDAVLMAAAVPAQEGQAVLELGCGAGVASLCLKARVAVEVTGLERQAEYVALAQQNGLHTMHGDLAHMPDLLRQQSFDHVMANPPYYRASDRSAARDAGREAALSEETPLFAWVDAAIRRLKPKGYLTMIQNADRLPDLLSSMDARLGAIRVLPLAPRAGRDAHLVLVQARKGGRTPFVLRPPLILHEGDKHTQDGESYRPDVRGILRDGAALPI
ncbi:MAG: methyltransferase [Pseudomonadota bacterium]